MSFDVKQALCQQDGQDTTWSLLPVFSEEEVPAMEWPPYSPVVLSQPSTPRKAYSLPSCSSPAEGEPLPTYLALKEQNEKAGLESRRAGNAKKKGKKGKKGKKKDEDEEEEGEDEDEDEEEEDEEEEEPPKKKSKVTPAKKPKVKAATKPKVKAAKKPKVKAAEKPLIEEGQENVPPRRSTRAKDSIVDYSIGGYDDFMLLD